MITRIPYLVATCSLLFALPAAAQVVVFELYEPGIHVFGSDAAIIGDVNGDGISEVAVGTHDAVAFLYSGADGSLLFSYVNHGQGSGDLFGHRVARVGDLDGDGVNEVIVTARKVVGDPMTRVFSGATGALLWDFPEGGSSPAGLADLDGDGWPEIGIAEEHSVVVRSGATGAILFTDLPENERLNWIEDAGDVNGDGVGDFITGEAGWVNSGPGWGKVYSGADFSLLYAFPGDMVGDFFGMGVAGGGDVDGDGFDDFLISTAPWVNHDSTYARLFSGVDGSLIREFDHGVRPLLSGLVAAAFVGDIDLDGSADYAVGGGSTTELGAVRIYSGATGSILLEHQGNVVGDGFGTSLDSWDFDGDGREDLAIGSRFGTVQVLRLSPDLLAAKWAGDIADRIALLDLSLFDMTGGQVPAEFRDRLEELVRTGGWDLEDGKLLRGRNRIWRALRRLDGFASPPDWLLPGSEQAELATDLTWLVGLAERL